MVGVEEGEGMSYTGWDTGLCQDYNRKLSLWFASRLDARAVLRRWFGEQRAKK